MAEVAEKVVPVTLEMGLVVTGCKYRDKWDEAALLEQNAGLHFYFLAEPDNKHDPKAMKAMFMNKHVGYVGAEHLDDLRVFYVAYKMMKPFMDGRAWEIEIGEVSYAMPDCNRVSHFEVFITVSANVPESIEAEINAL